MRGEFLQTAPWWGLGGKFKNIRIQIFQEEVEDTDEDLKRVFEGIRANAGVDMLKTKTCDAEFNPAGFCVAVNMSERRISSSGHMWKTWGFINRPTLNRVFQLSYSCTWSNLSSQRLCCTSRCCARSQTDGWYRSFKKGQRIWIVTFLLLFPHRQRDNRTNNTPRWFSWN